MARRKRGGKLANARKAKAAKQLQSVSEDSVTQSPAESEESCSSGTPKSCNTPIEIDKSVNPSTLVQHKKFGKFRCLAVDDASKTEVSSSDSDLQMDCADPIALDSDTPKETQCAEYVDETVTIVEDLKTVEIADEHVNDDIPIVCSEEVIHEVITEDNIIDELHFEEACTVVEETEIRIELDTVPEAEEDVKEEVAAVAEEDDQECQLMEDSPVIEDNQDDLQKEEISSSPDDQNDEKQLPDDGSMSIEETAPKIEETKQSTTKEPAASEDSTTTVRRSSRIKSISVLKQRSRGRGLVKSDKLDKRDKAAKSRTISSDLETICENSNNSNTESDSKTFHQVDSPSFATPILGVDGEQKPVKVKSRWRRSSELEMGGSSPLAISNSNQSSPIVNLESDSQNGSSFSQMKSESPVYDEEMENRLRQFQTLLENHYLTERTSCKEAKKMVCDCFLTKEEIERGEFGCGEDCLNRLLMIECGNQCTVGHRCTNKRFQKLQYAPCEVFRTDKKGFGIRAIADIPYGEFILEYVGEVLDPDEFDKRAKEYSKDKNRHYYFMALRADAVIDATQKGNISRFINHSCDPNAETQKWTVNGELRIGFFSKRTILANEEITFDYQFQRYGKEAQKCFCEATSCRGWIGEEPDDDEDEEESEEEEEEEEVDDETAEERKEADSTEIGVKEPKIKVKPQVRKRRLNKKQRKDFFDDLDLDEEIEMLSISGVKNQAHTLKLSRLMVRAKDVATRMQVLKLLREGELPCRRLFLDYHGLRLIHGWMCDAASMMDEENKNHSFKIEILQTLASLPIPNKTLLQDSKVLSTIEKWSHGKKSELVSPVDSASNSPQIDAVVSSVESEKKDPRSTPMPTDDPMDLSPEIGSSQTEATVDSSVTVAVKIEDNKSVEEVKMEVEQPVTTEVDIKMEETPVENTPQQEEVDEKIKLETAQKIEAEKMNMISELTAKLLSDWTVLKEVFRIPKKERIEQMKEHEREADRDYKPEIIDQQSSKRESRYSWKNERYRTLEKERRNMNDILEHDRIIPKKGNRLDDRNILTIPRLSKYERRQLFALQVAQEEEGRRRKQEQEQEMWRIHEHKQRCMMMGPDPRVPKPDMSQYPCYWTPGGGHGGWPPPEVGGQPPGMYDMNMQRQSLLQNPAQPHMPPMMMPPLPGAPCMTVGRPSLLSQPPMMTPPPQQSYPPSQPQLQQPYPSPQSQPQAYQPPPVIKEEILFAGPIPPPVKLPPKWKCAKDKYGRPYYYHIKLRVPKWEPPEFPPSVEETTTELCDDSSSSSESSSLTSDSSSESDDDSELGDTKLLLEIRNKLNMKHLESRLEKKIIHPTALLDLPGEESLEDSKLTDIVLKRKRDGLVQEIIISPRREEDKIASKIEIKKYKETKDKLRRQKQLVAELNKKKLKVKISKTASSKGTSSKGTSSKGVKKHRMSKSAKLKSVSNIDMNSEEARKIKEIFRSSMASVIVQNLNSYRKPDCKMGRITNTEDFKHLARKLTHFVMLKELKHCKHIEDLTCNESVKSKSKEFIKKYMAKFGDIYSRPKDDLD